MTTTLLRTQIYLPENLRKDIDRARSVRGKTLAEFLREAAEEKLKKEKKGKLQLEKLAELIGSVRTSAWKDIDVVKWQRKIREDRDSF